MRKLMNLNNIYDIFVKNENSSFGKKKKYHMSEKLSTQTTH